MTDRGYIPLFHHALQCVSDIDIVMRLDRLSRLTTAVYLVSVIDKATTQHIIFVFPSSEQDKT